MEKKKFEGGKKMKIIRLFIKYFIILPLAILMIPFILIGIAGINQISKCIAGTSKKKHN